MLLEGRTPQQAEEASDGKLRQAKEWFAANKKMLLKYEAKTLNLNVVCVLSRGHVVNEEYSVKLLGFIVDQKLSLGVHVRDVVKRLSIGRF